MQEEIRKVKHIFIFSLDEISIKTIDASPDLIGRFTFLLLSHGLNESHKIFDEKGRGIIFRREVEVSDIITS